jgi:cytoskeleton protein RodZ
MTEVADAVVGAPLEAPVPPQASAGTLLRRAREASGLHVAALAVSLKVPVRKLEALEDGRFDDLGDAVFIRALASSVCRTLKVDPQPVLERLPQTSAPRLVRDTDGLNAPFRAPGDGPAPTWFDILRQPVPMAVFALLVGAVVIFLLPATRGDEKADAAAPAAAPAEFIPAPVASMPAAAATTGVAPAVAAPVFAPGAAPAPAPAPATATIASTVLVPSPTASSAPATPPGPTTGIVVLHTRAESWVEVVDAKGVPVVRKIMARGETAGATGALPLTVTVGKADVTDVDVRGKKFDLKPVSKDNVARFEVK